ncbi:hypothetical protein [Marinospirillum sp.]|uniref:hypothetical protein n=1 Tax=Marinospirillum sp. TaxID=2183934 RepID=UPI00384C6536
MNLTHQQKNTCLNRFLLVVFLLSLFSGQVMATDQSVTWEKEHPSIKEPCEQACESAHQQAMDMEEMNCEADQCAQCHYFSLIPQVTSTEASFLADRLFLSRLPTHQSFSLRIERPPKLSA